MATGDIVVVLNNKQSLGLVELRDNFLDVIDKWDNDVVGAMWPVDGWFLGIPAFTGGTSEFSLQVDVRGTDGIGNLIETGQLPSHDQDVPFENASAVHYGVGLIRARIATVVKASWETGIPQYTAEQEIVGWLDTPDAVAVNHDGLDFVVDGITEVGVPNVGRTIRVYLVDPVSTDPDVVFEEIKVVWDGGHNVITTVGHFGQSTPSVVAADYVVCLLGPRVSRNTDLAIVDGILFAGTITGNGGGTPTSFDYSDATDFIPWPDFNNITEYGPNGDLKVSVKSHASDADIRQISVLHTPSGEFVFQVDEAGEVIVRDISGNVVMNFNPSGLGHIWDFGGWLRSTQGKIVFDDVNSNPVSFSETGGETDLPFELQERTILGGFKAMETEHLISTGVVNGATPTDGGGLDLNLTAAIFYIQGFAYDVEADVLGLSDNQTKYVYYSRTTKVYQAGYSYQADTENSIYIAKVTTAAGAITEIVDVRRTIRRMDRRTDIYVGTPSTTTYGNEISHFATLADALAAIDVWVNDSVSQERDWYRICVVGDCIETATPLAMPCSRLEIVGGVGQTVAWSAATALFDLNGKSNLIFRGLEMSGPNGSGAGDPVRVAFTTTSAAATDHVLIERCQLDGGDAFFFNDQGASDDHYTIKDCVADSVGTCGVIYQASGLLAGSTIRIVGCRFAHNGGIYANEKNGIRLQGWMQAWVTNNHIAGFVSSAIRLDGIENFFVQDNFCDGDATTTTGIRLGGSGASGHVSENTVRNFTGPLVQIETGALVQVVGNMLVETEQTGIYIDLASHDSIIKGNIIMNAEEGGLLCGGNRVLVSGNNFVNVSQALNPALDIDGDACIIESNIIDMHASAPSDYAIDCNGTDCVIKGNIVNVLKHVILNTDSKRCIVGDNRLRLGGTIFIVGNDDKQHLVVANHLTSLAAGNAGDINMTAGPPHTGYNLAVANLLRGGAIVGNGPDDFVAGNMT